MLGAVALVLCRVLRRFCGRASGDTGGGPKLPLRRAVAHASSGAAGNSGVQFSSTGDLSRVFCTPAARSQSVVGCINGFSSCVHVR